MRRLLPLLAVAALGACGPTESVPTVEGAEAPQETSLAEDSRVRRVFDLTTDESFFERNLADPIPILIDRLRTAKTEPLRRAIEELGAFGDESIEALRREVERSQRDAADIGPLQNVISALGLNPSPRAADVLVELLGHPHSAIRLGVLRALTNTGARPEHASRLEWSAVAERGKVQAAAAFAFAEADPDLAAWRFVEWLEADQIADALETALAHLASHSVPELAERLTYLAEELPNARGVYLHARLAADGSRASLDAVLEAASSDDPEEHRGAVQAAFLAGLVDVLAAVVERDPDPAQRVAGVTALGRLLLGEAPSTLDEGEQRSIAEAALRGALDDENLGVRDEALSLGVRLGLPEATERALARLDGSVRDLTLIGPPLGEAMAKDRAVARRAYELLSRRLERESHLRPGQRLPTLQILGLVPDPEAARTLVRVGRETTEPLETLRAHEFLCVVASNTGVPGREALAEELANEPEPLRRIDLLWAIAAPRDEFARAFLESHVERDDLDPFEVLFTAARLAEVGPTARVAPRLKRVALRLEGEPRRGMNRLLHYWYGRSE